jgi:Arc/MetJ-type ribon-helix-helix transcriptional regulator
MGVPASTVNDAVLSYSSATPMALMAFAPVVCALPGNARTVIDKLNIMNRCFMGPPPGLYMSYTGKHRHFISKFQCRDTKFHTGFEMGRKEGESHVSREAVFCIQQTRTLYWTLKQSPVLRSNIEKHMIQAKFSISESHLLVLEECRKYGYKDRSALVRAAIDLLSAQIEQQRLQESAALYAEIYEQDEEASEWTNDAAAAWPK